MHAVPAPSQARVQAHGQGQQRKVALAAPRPCVCSSAVVGAVAGYFAARV